MRQGPKAIIGNTTKLRFLACATHCGPVIVSLPAPMFLCKPDFPSAPADDPYVPDALTARRVPCTVLVPSGKTHVTAIRKAHVQLGVWAIICFKHCYGTNKNGPASENGHRPPQIAHLVPLTASAHWLYETASLLQRCSVEIQGEKVTPTMTPQPVPHITVTRKALL